MCKRRQRRAVEKDNMFPSQSSASEPFGDVLPEASSSADELLSLIVPSWHQHRKAF